MKYLTVLVLAATFAAPASAMAEATCNHYLYKPGVLVSAEDWKQNKTSFCSEIYTYAGEVGWVKTDITQNINILQIAEAE